LVALFYRVKGQFTKYNALALAYDTLHAPSHVGSTPVQPVWASLIYQSAAPEAPHLKNINIQAGYNCKA
jgi:hypothetical protein